MCDLALTGLNPEEIELFWEKGFLLKQGVFNTAEINETSLGFEELTKQAQKHSETGVYHGSQFVLENMDSGIRIKRVVWCGAAVPKLLELGRSPKLKKLASQILECDSADHLINQAHFKYPHDGVHFPYHQDSTHRRYGTEEWTDVNSKGSYIQIIIAIDKSSAENGPLLLVPGSHAHGHLGLGNDLSEKEVLQYSSESSIVPVICDPGDCVLLHPYTIHGSMQNESETSRRIFINGYASPGANRRVYPGEGSGQRVSLT